ncbi:DUF2249 domain-containing protein [Pseudopelagicola sp. nBUS_20]|uniref:DUF2249 domain-containing protein n=1 Tax=Pseudopelagicola sp. nBUS_20 TaxID=3395317 RepID=UPI003EBC0DDE
MSNEVPGTYWMAADGLHVDTRGLPPPDPLVAVLWHITQPERNGPVIAHFDRDPVYLLPELAERGWSYEYGAPDSDEVRLTLRPAP